MKYAHKLTKNKDIQKPSRLIFTDTETEETQQSQDVFYHRLKLGWGILTNIRSSGKTEDKYVYYETTNTFWDTVDLFCKDKTRTYLYAHNQHFDFSVLRGNNELTRLGWELKSFFIHSNVFIMRFKKQARTLYILDSGNIVKFKLEDIGEVFNIPKLKIDFRTATMNQLSKYCKTDTEILRAFVLAFRNFVIEHELGNFRFTIASQSFTAFRHRFMKHDIFIHDNRRVISLERESYRGGINEAYYIGVLNQSLYRSLDVNSLYAYVMRKYKYPTKLKWIVDGTPIDYLETLLQHYAVISRVLIKCDEAVFPYKTDKVYYPTGEFITVLTTNALKYALERNWIVQVLDTAVYEQEYIFKDYVDFFNSLKEQYDEEENYIFYMITKFFLNGLTGKWGQRSRNYKEIGACNDWEYSIEKLFDYETKEQITEIRIAGKIYHEGEEHESFDSFVAIVSHITANARDHMIKLIHKAKRENVFYIDTDSLTVNEAGFELLKDGVHKNKLGWLKIQEIANKVEIRGAKDYKFGNENKIKGIKKDAIDLGNNQYSQLHFMKTRSMMRNKISDRAIIKRVTKKLKRVYDKGRVQKTGFVTPYNLPDDLDLLISS